MLRQLILDLKDNQEDYEFYPTTDEILKVITEDMIKEEFSGSLLDIGAGNGKVLETLKASNVNIQPLYAIEKSAILRDQMPKDIFVIGTEMETQSLIDKKMSIIFCNPPYSQYMSWITKIINEAFCQVIYFVIPERWESKPGIHKSIESRGLDYVILHTTDFLNSEDRAARAKVHVVRLSKKKPKNQRGFYYRDHAYVGPFEHWFNTNFKINADIDDTIKNLGSRSQTEKLQDTVEHELVEGRSLVNILETLYNNDIEKLIKNYTALGELDSTIFEELGIKLQNVQDAFKDKIKNYKYKYWHELFDRIDAITNKLTSQSRSNLLGTLGKHTSVDFTVDNAYAIIIWAIKNANKYFDEQLLTLYYELSSKDNVVKYKSNTRFLDDNWRFHRPGRHDNDDNYTHYRLEYRLVYQTCNTFSNYTYDRYDYKSGLHREKIKFLQDVCTVAKNLGFDVLDHSYQAYWHPGKPVIYYMNYKGKQVVFMRVKAFKNGNIHFQFNTDFMKALNITAGRLNKWIKDPEHCASEMDISINEAKAYFNNGNIQIEAKDLKLIEHKES